jgi:PEP-CTERM motif
MFSWQVGSQSGMFTSLATANTITAATPNPFSWSWTANEGSSIQLSFAGSASDGAQGGTIDNIRLTQDAVAAVPEPGEWAMMLAGLSVVGLIARRRKKA